MISEPKRFTRQHGAHRVHNYSRTEYFRVALVRVSCLSSYTSIHSCVGDICIRSICWIWGLMGVVKEGWLGRMA